VSDVDFRDSIGFVVLNDTQKSPDRKLPMLDSQIKKKLNPKLRIISPEYYSDFDIDSSVFEALMSVTRR
jgi:hypothetical protein